MTSLLGRMLRLFPDSVPLEDLFTEAVARLFETRPELCLAWLDEVGLPSAAPASTSGKGYVRVRTQRAFVPLERHDTASRPDLLIEVYRLPGAESVEGEADTQVVILESKIGSGEGPEQLRRYAEHLEAMVGFSGKALLYVTRAYDPKDPTELLSGLDENIRFKQLRWHDFYRFLRTVDGDALVEEVMTFMEEQGMASSYRFSTADLMALSGVPRAFEIFDETLGGEVKAELESFAGSKVRRESINQGQIRDHGRYIILAPLHDWDLFCFLGYGMRTSDGYPAAHVNLEARSEAVGKEASVAAMKRIALHEDWEPYNLDNPSGWAGVRRVINLANLLSEEDHVAAVRSFFVESIRQLRGELTAFKKEHPDLPWSGN